MKKLILLCVISLLLVSLVSAQEFDWDGEGVQTLSLWGRFLQSAGFTTGAIVPSGCTQGRYEEKVFDANGRTSLNSIGNACKSGDYMQFFSCGFSSKYSSTSQCNYGGALRTGDYRITNVALNPDFRYMYWCHDCEGIPSNEGFCLNEQNTCIFVRSLSEYSSFNCIKPSFSNLWGSSEECIANQAQEITCFTECVDGFFETKTVTATFCSEEGLRSVAPSNCIPPDAEGCTVSGTDYDAGDILCHQGNVVKCMGDDALTVEEICSIECENNKCISVDGEPVITEDTTCGELGGECANAIIPKDLDVYKSVGQLDCEPNSFGIKQVCYVRKDGTPITPPPITPPPECIEPNKCLTLGQATELGLTKLGKLDCGLFIDCYGESITPPTPPTTTTPETEKCTRGVGALCDIQQCSTFSCLGDDSGISDQCSTGWCVDTGNIGQGICGRVGLFSDGKTQRGFEPHPSCVVTAEEFKTDFCGWTTWAPDWFGTQCTTAYSIIIGIFIILLFLSQMGRGKRS